MNNSIQWPRAQYWDKPWNPIIGCNKISPACDNCYAESIIRRFKMTGGGFTPRQKGNRNPPKKGVVFCGNMTDLFGQWVERYQAANYIERTFGNESTATYLWLTKRPTGMCDGIYGAHANYAIESVANDMSQGEFDRAFTNQYFGITAEGQIWYDKRFGIFRCDKPEYAKGWLSVEPLLGPIDLHLDYIATEGLPFKWIVVGCESGPKRRPCQISWVENIVAQAQVRNIPVFVKQLDIDGKCVTDITKFPKHLQIRQVPWITTSDSRRSTIRRK